MNAIEYAPEVIASVSGLAIGLVGAWVNARKTKNDAVDSRETLISQRDTAVFVRIREGYDRAEAALIALSAENKEIISLHHQCELDKTRLEVRLDYVELQLGIQVAETTLDNEKPEG